MTTSPDSTPETTSEPPSSVQPASAGSSGSSQEQQTDRPENQRDHRAKTKRGGVDATAVLDYWQRLNKLPGGTFLFARLLGLFIPYTGSIKPSVQTLEPGLAVVKLKERRRVRNHLRSVHAIALANLAELTTGLATLSGMPDDARGILTGLDVQYTKKARGVITGTCTCQFPETSEKREYKIPVTLTDEQGDTVVTATATWLIGPKMGSGL